jgi:flagella basal body P-ring formation protein FlgA
MRLKYILLALWTKGAVAGCIVVSGSEVLAGDLAHWFPELSGVASGRVVMLAPRAGATRVVTPLEGSRLWAKLGLRDAPAASFCIERKSTFLTAAIVLPALRRSLPDESIQIGLSDFSRFAVPDGALDFPITGLQASAGTSPQAVVLWRGRVVSRENSTTAIWVRVRLRVAREMVVARRDLAPNEKIAPADLETRRGVFHPLDIVSADPTSFVGQIVRRPIRAGQRLVPSLLAKPSDVTSGQVVNVDVLHGHVHLRLDAVAEANGNAGDFIWLKQLSGGKKFKARVAGPQQVELQIGQDDSQTVSNGTRAGGSTR